MGVLGGRGPSFRYHLLNRLKSEISWLALGLKGYRRRVVEIRFVVSGQDEPRRHRLSALAKAPKRVIQSAPQNQQQAFDLICI